MSEAKNKQTKKRKPPWVLGGIVLVLLTFLILLQSSNVWKNISVDSARDTLILYALSSLNFIAFIIFAFILIRSLLKLRQERRALQLGSKIKTRLLFYFAAVSILPVIAMFVFSYLFMNRALERWLTQFPENAVRQTAVANLKKLKKTAPMLAKSLDNKIVTNKDLKDIIDVGDIYRLEIKSKQNKTLAFAEKSLEANNSSEINDLIVKSEEALVAQEIDFVDKEFDVTKAEMSDGKSLVMVIDLRSGGSSWETAKQSLIQFDRLKSNDIFFRQIALTTLGLLTFLLIFASSWTAFYIGKNLTRPIRALAEGADEIAKGNFTHRVETLAEDELELLVNSFNVMSTKLAENSDELESRRKYIETILQSLSTGVISFDSENHVTTINKAAIEMFKLEEIDFTKLKLSEFVSEDNNQILGKLLMRAKRIGQASEQTSLHREQTKEGSAEPNEDLPVALTASALPKENGVVLVIEDLTELIAAQRASAWQEVAKRMAHEIKNPLTPIQLSAERIAKKFNLKNDANNSKLLNETSDNKTTKLIEDGTETILREVSSLKSMVDEFSRYARLPEVRLVEGNINEVINQATQLYLDRIDEVKIETYLSKDLPVSLIDAEQLKRVFVNLIDNSCEAFEESNKVKKIEINSHYNAIKDSISIEFSDNGKGIPIGGFPKLFQPYFSTKGRGTGLGLAIVQRIISEHNGKIRAVTNRPKGAKFIIELSLSV